MSVKFKNNIQVDGYASADYLDLSTTTTRSVDIGEIAWNSTGGTFDMGLIGGVTLQAGQEMHIYGKATEAISNGDAVMFGGVQGDHLLLSKADAATINANPEYFIGVATQNFATNDFGYVTVFGKVRTLNTTAYSLGAVLYYDSTTTTDGKLTETEPSAPNAKIIVAAVVRVHATQGVLMVRPHVMPMLGEMQDVNTTLSKTTPVDADSLLLQDSADQSIWKRLTWANLKATLKTYFDTLYQSVLTNPVTGTGTTNYIPKFTGTSAIGNSIMYETGSKIGISTTSPLYKLSVLDTANTVAGLFGGGAASPSWMGIGTVSSGAVPFIQGYNNGITATTNISLNPSGGFVGVGTASPIVTLQIGNGSGLKQGYITGSGYDLVLGAAGGNLFGYATQTISTVFNTAAVPLGVGTNASQPLIFGTAQTERMRISSTGFVGIGTTSPTARLTIGLPSGGYGSTERIQNYLYNGTEFFKSYMDANWNFVNEVIQSGTNQSGYIVSTNGSERMRITKTGNVGIGTSSPSSSALLDISSTTKGFLPPRLRTSERDAIASPANGLMIYNTENFSVDVYDAAYGWRSLAWA